MSKALIFTLILIFVFIFGIKIFTQKFGPISIPSNKNVNQTISGTQKPEKFSIIATGLEIPWEIVELPDTSLLVTQRTGKLILISEGQVKTISQIPGVKVYGEGGLMGLAIHPEFEKNKFIYIYFTYSSNGSNTLNRVVRYKYNKEILTDEKVIVDKIPGAIYHNGGRIKFGPDNYLYITTGDSLTPSLAQDPKSLAGKILRVKDDGSIPLDNPFGNQVYSYGHRNPQGLAWDKNKRLFSTEHGRSNPSGYDEVNIIIKGRNYGWPTIEGSATNPSMESPFIQSGNETWAPAGSEFYNDSLFFAGLRGKALYEVNLKNGNAIIKKHLLNEYGRIRAVMIGSNNLLYISTSNRDGRGNPIPSDDKIIQLDPKQL